MLSLVSAVLPLSLVGGKHVEHQQLFNVFNVGSRALRALGRPILAIMLIIAFSTAVYSIIFI